MSAYKFLSYKNKSHWDLRHSSVVEHLPSMYNGLSLIPKYCKIITTSKHTSHWISKYPNPIRPYFNLIIFSVILFPNKVTFTGSGWACISGRHYSSQYKKTEWNFKYEMVSYWKCWYILGFFSLGSSDILDMRTRCWRGCFMPPRMFYRSPDLHPEMPVAYSAHQVC
jgi:hypothetical protein